jgi:hypothetical protein
VLRQNSPCLVTSTSTAQATVTVKRLDYSSAQGSTEINRLFHYLAEFSLYFGAHGDKIAYKGKYQISTSIFFYINGGISAKPMKILRKK